jgi:cytochrome c553
MRNTLIMVILGLLMAGPSYAWEKNGTSEMDAALDLPPNIERGKRIFPMCANCHTEDGSGMVSGIGMRRAPGYYPKLAGQHRQVIIKQLADIRSGNRDNPMMYPFTLEKYLGGPQEISDVTGYIATLKPSPENNLGSGQDLDRGKSLYETNCTECHGDYGEGDDEEFYPRIEGQHYNYLLRQLKWIRDGKRRNANKKMIRQVSGFTYREMMAVSDYVARMKPMGSKKSK